MWVQCSHIYTNTCTQAQMNQTYKGLQIRVHTYNIPENKHTIVTDRYGHALWYKDALAHITHAQKETQHITERGTHTGELSSGDVGEWKDRPGFLARSASTLHCSCLCMCQFPFYNMNPRRAGVILILGFDRLKKSQKMHPQWGSKCAHTHTITCMVHR